MEYKNQTENRAFQEMLQAAMSSKMISGKLCSLYASKDCFKAGR